MVHPAMWLLRRELRAIHEYEADEAVLDSGVDARSYQMLLIKKAAGGRWYSIANSFNHSKLKNRITMMLRKKSSRWAGARGAPAPAAHGRRPGLSPETAYVFPEDKGKKNQYDLHSGVEIFFRWATTADSGRRPGGEVDGQPRCRPDRSRSPCSRIPFRWLCTAKGRRRRDSCNAQKTGEPGDGAQVPGLKGKVVTVTRADSARTNESTTVRVIGHGTRPKKDGTVVVNTAGIAKSYRFKVENGSSVESNPVFIVDGVQVSEIESLDPDQIESMSVIKGTNLPGVCRQGGMRA